MNDNRQYQTLLNEAAEKLRTVYPSRLALRAGVKLDEEENALCFSSFGQEYKVRCSDWSIEPETNMWHHMIILQYLEGANSMQLNDRWIALRELPHGSDSRAAGFERQYRERFEKLGEYSAEQLKRACEAMGAEFLNDRSADLSAVFPFMPQYPIRMNFWFADEADEDEDEDEFDAFPASGKLLVNDGVRTTLNMEAAGQLMLFLMKRLCAEARRLG